jgi:cellulose synthase/poly-beta-1,6-N-acetylglucosamine synthase-like glycosyltransferase
MLKGFSVLMPTCNQAGFIRRAILSLQNQTYKHWEFIIINDGCTDDTDEFVIECCPIRLYRLLAFRWFYYENHLEEMKIRYETESDTFLIFSNIKSDTRDSLISVPMNFVKGLAINHPLQLRSLPVNIHSRGNPLWNRFIL